MRQSIALSVGEWQIMGRLWQENPRTLTALVRKLGPDTGWSKSTIITMVSRPVSDPAPENAAHPDLVRLVKLPFKQFVRHAEILLNFCCLFVQVVLYW